MNSGAISRAKGHSLEFLCPRFPSLSASTDLLPSLLLANGTTNGTIIPGYNGTQSELNGTSIFIRKVSACVACESTLEVRSQRPLTKRPETPL